MKTSAQAYGLLSNKVDKVQTQAGVRLEDAATYLGLTTVGQQYDRRYASAYPSAILSYNFTQLRSARIAIGSVLRLLVKFSYC